MSGKKEIEALRLPDLLVLSLAFGTLKRMNKVGFGHTMFELFLGYVLI